MKYGWRPPTAHRAEIGQTTGAGCRKSCMPPVTTSMKGIFEVCNSLVFLFLGGFLIAKALERWGLHRLIADIIIRIVCIAHICVC